MVTKMGMSHHLITIIDEAVANIKGIVSLSKKEIPHVYNLKVSGSKFNTTTVGTKGLIKAYLHSFSPSYQQSIIDKKRKAKRELLKSIEIVKKHYRIIQKLKEGTHEEAEWASTTIDTIQSYNSLLLRCRQKPKGFWQFFSRFLVEHADIAIIDEELIHNLIDIPTQIFIQFDTMTKEEKRIEPS